MQNEEPPASPLSGRPEGARSVADDVQDFWTDEDVADLVSRVGTIILR